MRASWKARASIACWYQARPGAEQDGDNRCADGFTSTASPEELMRLFGVTV